MKSGDTTDSARSVRGLWNGPLRVPLLLGGLVAAALVGASYRAGGACFVFCASALALALVALFTRGAARVVFVNLAVIAAMFEVFELYYVFLATSAPKPVYDIVYGIANGYYKPDPYLGYGPAKDVRARSRLIKDGKVLYDVVYTIDAHGLRARPEGHPSSDEAILFFGCSFTFGEGVNDDQTLPAYVESFDQRRRKALNFGFHGYGPHQMLTILEHGLERPALEGSHPGYAVYFALGDHIRRVAGRTSWDNSSIHYMLTPGGELAERPRLDSGIAAAYPTLERSQLFSHLLDATVFRSQADVGSEQESKLFVAVVARSARLFEQHYGGHFIVLLADGVGGAGEWPAHFDPAAALRAEGIEVVKALDLAQTYYSDPAMEIRGDRHPSALAYERIARALVKRLP